MIVSLIVGNDKTTINYKKSHQYETGKKYGKDSVVINTEHSLLILRCFSIITGTKWKWWCVIINLEIDVKYKMHVLMFFIIWNTHITI